MQDIGEWISSTDSSWTFSCMHQTIILVSRDAARYTLNWLFFSQFKFFLLSLLKKYFFCVAVVTLQKSSFLFWYWDYLIIWFDNWYFCSCFKGYNFHSLPDARRSAVLFSFNAVTAFVCPFRTSIRFPLMTENTTIVVSSDPLIMMSSSEVIVRQRTAPRCSLKRFLKMYDSQSRFMTHVPAVILFILIKLTDVALICLLENMPHTKF